MSDRSSHPPPEEWDYPNPIPLRDRIEAAVAEFAPEADRDAMVLVLDLMRLASRIQQDLETNVHRPSGSTWAAFRIIFTIRHAGPMSPLELARLFSVSQPSISSVVNGLEQRGLITRVASPEDGRSVLIELTPKGDEVATELFRRQNKRESAWGKALTGRERKTLDRLVAKMLARRPSPPSEPAQPLPQLGRGD